MTKPLADPTQPTQSQPSTDHAGPSAASSRHDAEQLIELLTAQRDLYRQLQDLAARQATLISQGQTEDLLGVLTQRQQRVDQLGTMNEQVRPYRERITDLAQVLPDDRRRVLRELVDEVQSILQSIIDGDEADRRQLEVAKATTAAQASQTTHAGTALSAYRQQTPPNPRFANHTT